MKGWLSWFVSVLICLFMVDHNFIYVFQLTIVVKSDKEKQNIYSMHGTVCVIESNFEQYLLASTTGFI